MTYVPISNEKRTNMSAEYDFYQNPVPPGSNRKPRLHARIVTNGTVSTEELAEEIHARCTLTIGDIHSTLISLSQVIAEHLREGERIHIKGLGYLQMTLQCPPIKSPKEIRGKSVHFKSVAFRPEVELKNALKTTSFIRTTRKNHSNKYSEIEVDGLLTSYFLDNPYITREDFQHLCGFTKGTANRRLTKLVKEGKLQKEGLHRFPVYAPTPGNYRK